MSHAPSSNPRPFSCFYSSIFRPQSPKHRVLSPRRGVRGGEQGERAGHEATEIIKWLSGKQEHLFLCIELLNQARRKISVKDSEERSQSARQIIFRSLHCLRPLPAFHIVRTAPEGCLVRTAPFSDFRFLPAAFPGNQVHRQPRQLPYPLMPAHLPKVQDFTPGQSQRALLPGPLPSPAQHWHLCRDCPTPTSLPPCLSLTCGIHSPSLCSPISL